MSGWSIYMLAALKGIDAAEIIRRYALSLFKDRTEITWTLEADRIGNLFNLHVSGGTEIIFCHVQPQVGQIFERCDAIDLIKQPA